MIHFVTVSQIASWIDQGSNIFFAFFVEFIIIYNNEFHAGKMKFYKYFERTEFYMKSHICFVYICAKCIFKC